MGDAPLAWDADPLCGTTKAGAEYLQSKQQEGSAGAPENIAGLVQNTTPELPQISDKAGAFQRDLSRQRAPAQLCWDHTQQSGWGQLPGAATCQGCVCLVTAMGKSPSGPERGYFSAAPGHVSEQLLSGSPRAFLLPVLHRSLLSSLLTESSPPGRRVGPSQLSGLPWSVYQI